MITLESIIQAEFEESDVDKVVSVLSSHGFYSQIIIGINLVNKHLGQMRQEIKIFGTVQVGHLIAGLLIKTNESLRTLKDDEKKVEIEQITSSIYRQLLKRIINELPVKNRPIFGFAAYSALEETCDLYDYNFKKLLGFLGILDLANTQAGSISAEDIVKSDQKQFKEEAPGYVWTGKRKFFPGFLDIVVELGITDDIEAFEKLFESPSGGLGLALNSKKTNYVLQFFAYLNEEKFIRPHGNGYGFYQVLQFHVNAFDSDYLQYGDIYRKIEGVKRLVKWPDHRNKFEAKMHAIKIR